VENKPPSAAAAPTSPPSQFPDHGPLCFEICCLGHSRPPIDTATTRADVVVTPRWEEE